MEAAPAGSYASVPYKRALLDHLGLVKCPLSATLQWRVSHALGKGACIMGVSRKGLATLAVGALLLTACGGGGEDPGEAVEDVDFSAAPEGTMRTMGYNPDDEVGKSRSDLAAERLEGVTIDMDTTSFDPQKFAALSASGDLPDVVQMDRSSIATFAQKNLIMPLTECFDASDVDADDYWYDAVVEEASWDGSIYGAAQFFQPNIIIINKRVADKADVTAEDLDTSKPDQLVEAAKKMTELNGSQPTTLGFDPDVPGSVTTWIEIYGGSVMDDDGKPTLDDPKNVDAMEFLTELMEAQGGYTEVTSFKQTWDVFGDQNQYAADQVGAATWAQWYINVLANAKDAVELDAVPVRDLDGKAFATAGGTALAIPTAAKNPVAGCKWLTTVTSLDAWKAAGDARAATVEEKGSINTGLFTGVPSADQAIREAHVTETGNAGFDTMINTTYEVLDDTRAVGSSPVGQQINEALKNAAGAVLTGEKTAADALKAAQDTAMREFDSLN